MAVLWESASLSDKVVKAEQNSLDNMEDAVEVAPPSIFFVGELILYFTKAWRFYTM